MSTMTLTVTAVVPPAAAAPLLDPKRASHVPLACFGNGRRLAPPKNNKLARKPDLFVPSKALEDIVAQMPEMTNPRWGAALAQLCGSGALLVLSVVLLHYSPWFFLPVAWTLAGAALSLLFIIGHDCAHGNWSPSPLINTLVGELSFLLLLQPFESFKLGHSLQLAGCDAEARDAQLAAPATEQQPKSAKKAAAAAVPSPPTNDVGQSLTIEPASSLNTEPLPWWMQQFFNFLAENYQPQDVPAERKTRVYASVLLNATFAALFLVRLLSLNEQGGLLGVVRFWALPLLAYRAMYSGICRLWTLNVRAFLPRDNQYSFRIASYNYALLTKRLALEYGDAVKNSSLVSLLKQWIPRIHWINAFILTFVPIVSMIGMFTTTLQRPTLIFAVIYYFVTGMGITAGYHRLFAHKAYEAAWLTRVYLMLTGSGALQGSIKWWCGGHRIHHRYTDTPKDPYNAQGGFWYAHIGWMLVKPDPANFAKSDIRDLNADPMIRWQHKYYLFIGPFMAFVFPTLVAGLGWGDWLGGYFFAGAFRLCMVHHSTFCVNSVAHYFGEHTFDDDRSPRDHVITALLTFGEGYHNFHHEFPNDYRNGIQWYHYDPTKWMIAGLHAVGLTSNLKVFPKNEIRRGVLYMREKKLAELRAQVVPPKGASNLPRVSWAAYVERVKVAGEQLLVVDNFVHDVSPFVLSHPGGAALLKAYLGTDATLVFRGQTQPVVYKHSMAALNLLSNMRVAVIDGKPSDAPATLEPILADKKEL